MQRQGLMAVAEKLHTIAAAAQQMDCHYTKVYRLVWSGALRAVDLNNLAPRRPGEKAKRPAWRIPQSAIDALAASNPVPGSP